MSKKRARQPRSHKKAEGYAEFMALVNSVDGDNAVLASFMAKILPAAIETANDLHRAGHGQAQICVGLAEALGVALTSTVACVSLPGGLRPFVNELLERTTASAHAAVKSIDGGSLQ